MNASTFINSSKLVTNQNIITFRPFIGRIGSKRKIAQEIVFLIPPHDIYVEPFIGGGIVFLSQKSKIEIINDNDRDLYFIWLDMKAIGEKVVNMDFVCDRSQFNKLQNSKPKNRFRRLFRNLYLTIFSFSRNRKTFVGEKECVLKKNPGKLLKANAHKIKERLKNVTILNQDFRTVISRFDTNKTFFYFDPPYISLRGFWGYTPITPIDIYNALKNVKGKFILSYENIVEIKKLFSGNRYRIKKINTVYQLGGQREDITELLIMNF